MIGEVKDLTFNHDGTQNVTVVVTSDFTEEFEALRGHEVDIEIKDSPLEVKMSFVDDGIAYDPLAHVDPDTTLPAEERPIGGLGILMVKKLASSISYSRVHAHNILAVELRPRVS